MVGAPLCDASPWGSNPWYGQTQQIRLMTVCMAKSLDPENRIQRKSRTAPKGPSGFSDLVINNQDVSTFLALG